MRIALYENLPSGGAKRAVFEWARRLSLSHILDIFTLSSSDQTFCDLHPFANQYHVFEFKPRRLFHTPFGRLNQVQRWRDLHTLEEIDRKIAQWVNKQAYDVVLINPSMFTLVPPIIQYLKIPSVYYLHEPVGIANNLRYDRPDLRKSASSFRRLLDRFDPSINLYSQKLHQLQISNLSSASLLLSNSRFTQEQMKLNYGLDSKVCYLGVDSEEFSPLPGTLKEKVVLSVGELTPRKGFDFLIKSLASIEPDSRPGLHLASNWEDPFERNFLESIAAAHQVDVCFLGRLNQHELRLAYTQSRLCLFAPHQEPFGLAVLEAMACGAAVIGVNEAGLKETIHHQVTGLIVDRSPKLFAQAISELIEDDHQRKRLGEQAREDVRQRWTWEIANTQLERNLLTVL